MSYKARFEILTLGLLNIHVFSDVTPRGLVNGCRHCEGLQCLHFQVMPRMSVLALTSQKTRIFIAVQIRIILGHLFLMAVKQTTEIKQRITVANKTMG
jgi:hypothetical protein